MAKPVVPPRLSFFNRRRENYSAALSCSTCHKTLISHHKKIVTACYSYSLTWELPTCPTCLCICTKRTQYRKLSSVSRSRRRSESTFPSELAPVFGSLLVVTLILVSLSAGHFYFILICNISIAHARGPFIKSTSRVAKSQREREVEVCEFCTLFISLLW